MKRSILVFVVLPLISLAVSAQKLPNIQESSLRAPAAIKVDGKATEWNNQFQAYNKATEIFYTISNDNEKLYLTVQATDLDIINKIICKGITLSINGTGKMKDQEGISITFPELTENSFPRDYRGSPYASIPINLDKPENMEVDIFMVTLNKELSSIAKEIRVTGVKAIPDNLISIYNPEGIKAVALFDKKTIFTYELAVPLKHLGLSINTQKSFVYNIKLKGMNPDMADVQSIAVAMRIQRQEIRESTQVPLTLTVPTGTVVMMGPGPRLQTLFSPTDFSGEYTLAK